MNQDRVYLIIGCGYLGRYLLEELDEEKVIVTSRNQTKLENFEQEGFENLYFDINEDRDEFFQQLTTHNNITIFFLLPPSKVQLEGLENFLQKIKDLSIHKAIMISSTVVYGNEPRLVDADSLVMLDSERAKKQYSIEKLWLEISRQFYSVRLAGIYGKERVIGIRNLQQQKPISSDPDAWLNLIHVEDAAKLVCKIAESSTTERVELGCDNHPVKRREYYSWLASQLNSPQPIFENKNEARGANRQCSSQITQQRTGWQPFYKNYQEGIRAALRTTSD